MTLSGILVACLIFNGGAVKCDVRVQYIVQTPSTIECKQTFNEAAQELTGKTMTMNKGSEPVVVHGDCIPTYEMPGVLNGMPDFYKRIGYEYNLSFY